MIRNVIFTVQNFSISSQMTARTLAKTSRALSTISHLLHVAAFYSGAQYVATHRKTLVHLQYS